MKVPKDSDMEDLVSNEETKVDLENDSYPPEVKALDISDFQKFKMLRDQQVRRKWMIGGLCGFLAFSTLLSIYSVCTVRELSEFIQLMNERVVKEEGLSLENSVGLKLQGGPNNGNQESEPIMFDCTRTTRFQSRGIVNYDECLVDTTGGSMNITSGIFTASTSQGGIYQISFTAKYVANSNGRFGAWSDVFVNDVVIADSQREYNGFGGKSRTESSTHTVMALYPVKEMDTIRVQFNKDGYSYIHSDSDHDVHFTARKIAALPIGDAKPRNVN
eukprot:GFUD01023630.1.p1 GENE.GFUD01023630.1~~GFUD01023630.1.p1  ORF type:complete len:274 (+),score=50.63 GFUD01023630.1:16-837(+)